MDTKSGTIVVGVDASASSLRALAWAIDQAQLEHRGGKRRAARGRPAGPGCRPVRDRGLGACPRGPRGLGIDDPRNVLLEMSRDAAMVVLGSRGRGKLRSLLLGSVGVALVRHAHCPVVVHRPGNPGVVRNGVVVGADGSEESLAVLEFAYREASLRDLPLTVVHCFWDVITASSAPYVVSAAPVELESERLLLAESMAGMAEKFPDVKVQKSMARGLPQDVLVSLGERTNLLVVGAHQAVGVSRMLFGSVSVAVVEHASCPVAVVPTAPSD